VRYAVSFLEGIITFISPCLLPLLPVYISYFTGGDAEKNKKRAMLGSVGFIAGFTAVFILLGAFAGLLGGFLKRYQVAVNIITGSVVVVFGLNFLGILNIGLLNNVYSGGNRKVTPGFFPAALFGMVFSVSWTPCAGAFLGSALMLASQQGSVIYGVFMLLCYSLGLGLPFFISAMLIDELKTTFSWIKRHYKTVNIISGLFLIMIGVLMISGRMGRLLAMLTITGG